MQPATTNLNSEEFNALLEKLNACQDARDWTEGKDLVTAWTTCHRAGWLLWLVKKAAPLDPITNELLICRFAREVHHLNPDPRVLASIETREAWARGEVSDAVRTAARDAVWAAVWGAAGNAFGVAAVSAARTAVGVVAVDAAEAASWAAGEIATEGTTEIATEGTTGNAVWVAAWAVARDAAWAKQADIIRELVPMPVLA